MTHLRNKLTIDTKNEKLKDDYWQSKIDLEDTVYTFLKTPKAFDSKQPKPNIFANRKFLSPSSPHKQGS